MQARRNTELWLLIAAAPVLLLLFAMLLVNANTELTVTSFAVPIALIASFFVAHIVLRSYAKGADPALLPLAFAICGIGICFVLRLAPDDAPGQIALMIIGVALMAATVILVPSLEKIGEYKYTCLLIALILLLMPLIPGLGHEANGSRIWIRIAGFSFQPGEIAKIFLVLFLASYLAENREMLSVFRSTRIGIKLPDFHTLMPLLAMWAVSLLIVVFEKDLGSALLCFGIFLAMLYAATGRLSYIFIALALVAMGAFGLYTIFDHVQVRIAIWRDPFADPSGTGYQLVQSLYSVADGGMFGTGIGRGMPTLIPEVQNDFIFSAIAEEMGLLGAAGVIILFMLFAVRGLATAARAKSDVAAFTAVGLTASICLQAFIIIAGDTDFIPLTGLTLPFMSLGGSSLLSSFIILGLLLRAGDEGTGLETEMTTTIRFSKVGGSGVLGRAALGKRLTILITFFAILFALLIANLTYLQVFKAQELQTMPGNNHTLIKEAERERGAILTSDNIVLAKSVENENGTFTREYPEGTLASHVVGYFSQRFGASGVEASMNQTLVGDQNFATVGDALRSYAGMQTSGNDVRLTLNAEIQRAAESALAGHKGACVVLDTKTGAVLAEVSAPTYSAGDVEDLLGSSDTSGSLLNRATSSLYAPGSSFKTVTLGAALDTDTVSADSLYDSPSEIEIGNAPITNYHEAEHGTITVARATEVSSNTVFAQISDQLGADKLVSYAEKFGFNNDDLAQDFSLTASLMPDPNEMTEWETAWSGVGQPVGEHKSPAGPQATPMQMAVVMAAIANNGTVLKPYIVDSVLSSSGEIISTTSPQILGQAISASAAQEEQEILKGVVEEGSGTAANVGGATVMGKTGTAETNNENSDAWFVGTATANGKSVTVAILIEQGNSGGEVAAPRAGSVFEAALEALGAL